ncbi:hypothetical protein C8R44DRAFT_876775 [Mycena epipterygia]|nr:hypothetical protein C8R44DRAFT_876775 [Mycena epipterygia]
MAPYLTLLTHLCAHLLGLMGSPVLTPIFCIVALLAYGLYLSFLPAAWPGRILHDTLTRIEAMKTRLHEEAALRRTLEMYNLSTYGLRGLAEFQRRHEALADDHGAQLATPLPYIQRLDNPDTPGDEETASRGRAWFDAVLTASID